MFLLGSGIKYTAAATGRAEAAEEQQQQQQQQQLVEQLAEHGGGINGVGISKHNNSYVDNSSKNVSIKGTARAAPAVWAAVWAAAAGGSSSNAAAGAAAAATTTTTTITAAATTTTAAAENATITNTTNTRPATARNGRILGSNSRSCRRAYKRKSTEGVDLGGGKSWTNDRGGNRARMVYESLARLFSNIAPVMNGPEGNVGLISIPDWLHTNGLVETAAATATAATSVTGGGGGSGGKQMLWMLRMGRQKFGTML